ncbi:MAG: tripartite tricarboxylate transporter substrate binding protein [Proteobacteria bacterium]|nr:tripartite tricarboxylate transporter substrate binding protein [Burkholderiales bacterium]
MTLVCAASAGSVFAADVFQNRPLRVVVPYPPGGTSDTQIRIIGPRLAESIGQPVLIDNRPGASGMLGAELVARSNPDGHTLVMTDVGNLVMTEIVHPNAPYVVARDFAAVTLVSFTPHLLGVNPALPVQSVADLVKYAKANPGKLNFATSLGGATHFAGLLFAQHHGLQWVEIPTKGGTDSITQVMTGQSDLVFNSMVPMMPQGKSGKLRILAVTSPKRVAQWPELPTMAEAGGIPGFSTGSWQGLLVPVKVRSEVVERLAAEVGKALAAPEVRDRYNGLGTEIVANSPTEFTRWLRDENRRWGEVAKKANLKVQF